MNKRYRKILAEHSKWLETGGKEGKRARLSRANLSRANLSKANLSRANLFGADLFEANLFGARLSRANLSKANLFGANLFGADLFGANLSKADLFEANLSGARLFEADLSKADLFGANLSFANLSFANLSFANLSKANLYKADLFGATLPNGKKYIPLTKIEAYSETIEWWTWMQKLKSWNKLEWPELSKWLVKYPNLSLSYCFLCIYHDWNCRECVLTPKCNDEDSAWNAFKIEASKSYGRIIKPCKEELRKCST